MRAISVRQPWAWLIVAGVKRVENRTWATSFRGPLLIHASQTVDLNTAELDDLRRQLAGVGVDLPEKLHTGGIIGQVNLVDCVTECEDAEDADWHDPGLYAFILRDAVVLPFRPMRGKLRFFDA